MTLTKELRIDRIPEDLDELAPGVYGICAEPVPGWLLIPLVIGIPPGEGSVSRYLDALPHDKNVVFTVVLSMKLAGMLLRRGFRPVTFCLSGHEPVEALARGAEGVE
jgi:hypothetical protein